MKAAVMDEVIGGRDDADMFERARRAGFAGVELELTRARDGARASAGLAIPSLVLGEHNHGGIADADPTVARAAAQDVRDAIAWAVELGADVVLVPFFLEAELVDEAGVDRCATAFRELCPAAAERGVTLAFEGTLPAERVRALAARVESRAFGCYFDFANAVVAGFDPAAEIRALGDLVTRVHLKDTVSARGDSVPGLGRVDFHAGAAALAEIGYDGWLVLETPPGPWEVVARDLAFAHTVFPTLEPTPAWPRLGAFSYDFGAGDWERMHETFATLGLDAVQLGGDLLLEALADPERAAAGLDVVALAGYRNLIAPDPATRRDNIDFIARCLELAPALGTSVVATEAGTRNPDSEWGDHPDNRTEEAWALLVDAVEALLPVAERNDTVLALEASVKHVLATQDGMERLLERFPSRNLQVVCDPYNYLSSDLLPSQERATRGMLDGLEHRFVLAHLKDVGAGGAEDSTPEFGTGVFAQRPYLEFLRTQRPDLPLILEHLPLDRLAAAIERVRELSRP